MRSDLCGHILTVNCGKGDLDIIINNSNFGGGLDLYGSTWDRATGNLPPSITSCSVALSSRTAMGGSEPIVKRVVDWLVKKNITKMVLRVFAFVILVV